MREIAGNGEGRVSPSNSQSDHRLRTVLPAREAGHSYYLPKGRQTLFLDSIKTVH